MAAWEALTSVVRLQLRLSLETKVVSPSRFLELKDALGRLSRLAEKYRQVELLGVAAEWRAAVRKGLLAGLKGVFENKDIRLDELQSRLTGNVCVQAIVAASVSAPR